MLIGFEKISAQTDTTAVYRIILNDDLELLGKIKGENESLVLFITNAGLELNLEKKVVSHLFRGLDLHIIFS